MKNSVPLCLLIACLGFLLSARAQDDKAHPLIQPFPGSVLDPNAVYRDAAEHAFKVTEPVTGKEETTVVHGKFWRLTYRLRDATGRFNDRTHSLSDYREHYKGIALKHGGRILYETKGELTFSMPGNEESTVWCHMHIWNFSQQDLTIIEEAGPGMHVKKDPVTPERPGNATQHHAARTDIKQLIAGTWKLHPNARAAKGLITFDANGTYELQEELRKDGTKVGTKGEYRLNAKATPATIDLCAGKCGQPGSEWTTRFGIIKVVSDNELEICTSPSSKYPLHFSDDKTDLYTMVLTRAEQKK